MKVMALYATFGFFNSLSYLAKAGKFKLRAYGPVNTN